MTHPRSNPADASAQNISVFPSRHLQLPQASLLPPPTIKQQSQHKKQNLGFSLHWRGGGKLRGKKSLPWVITQNSKMRQATKNRLEILAL